jgi:hypothetical protein
MIERVMIFTPYGPRLELETVTAVLNLEWDGPLRFVLQKDNPTGLGREDILHQYQRARRLFLAGDEEAMLVIESDIIQPPDALLRLARLDADAAYGVYRFRVSDVVNIFERYPVPRPRNEGESLSLHPHLLNAARQAGVIPCSGGGLGCVLIHRHVLEAVDFRMEDTAHCDTYFNRDLLRAGYRQLADMDVVCGHKSEDGTVLWPF